MILSIHAGYNILGLQPVGLCTSVPMAQSSIFMLLESVNIPLSECMGYSFIQASTKY